MKDILTNENKLQFFFHSFFPFHHSWASIPGYFDRKMKKARENFEYRVTQPSREIRDFVEYIKYERSIIVLTKQRTKVKRPNENHTICTLIANRMKQLYAQALSKFPHNIRFWDEYVKFLQQLKFAKDIPATFDRMLQVSI